MNFHCQRARRPGLLAHSRNYGAADALVRQLRKLPFGTLDSAEQIAAADDTPEVAVLGYQNPPRI